MKEVILKATDGTEIKLNINKTLVGYPYIERIDIIEPKTEFKVPGWYAFNKGKEDIIFYAISRSIAEGKLYETKDSWYIEIFCRPVTLQEIESHLRKIAEEKGFKKGITLTINCSTIYHDWNNCHKITLTYLEYRPLSDSLYADGITLYSSGKWAEIIPDKKLPCTKAELRALILKLHRIITTGKYPAGEQWTVDNFLKDYED